MLGGKWYFALLKSLCPKLPDPLLNSHCIVSNRLDGQPAFIVKRSNFSHLNLLSELLQYNPDGECNLLCKLCE